MEEKFKVSEDVNARVLKSWEEHAKREIKRYLETDNVTDIIGDCMKNEWLGPFTKFLYWFALNCETGWGVMVDFNEYRQQIFLCDRYYKWMHKVRDEMLESMPDEYEEESNPIAP
jgi:hypothetical protein